MSLPSVFLYVVGRAKVAFYADEFFYITGLKFMGTQAENLECEAGGGEGVMAKRKESPRAEVEVGIVTWCGTHRVFVRLIAGRSYPSGREFCGICGGRVESYEPVHAVYGAWEKGKA